MATSKELEARKRNGRTQAAKQKRATRNSVNQRQAASKRRAARRRRTQEDHDRDKRMDRYWRERRLRWEAEMTAVTHSHLPHYIPFEDASLLRRIQIRASR